MFGGHSLRGAVSWRAHGPGSSPAPTGPRRGTMRNLNKPGIWLGTIAVALAMGGTATAASMITSAQIKDGTITAKDIKRGSIGTAQLSSSAKNGMQGVSVPMGPIGPSGPIRAGERSTVGKIVL